MSGPVTFSGAVAAGGVLFRCLTGFIVRREQIGFLQRGSHRLVAANGRVLATLSSDRVNLFALEGQFRTVCGIDEGEIEGVTSLRVTQVLPAGNAVVILPLSIRPINLRTLLLLLLRSRLR